MDIYIDSACLDKCYALGWSYGEICVHCGCCSDDPKVRIPARINYLKEELESCKNFDDWFEDADLKALQEKNVKNSIECIEKELSELHAELEEVNK